MSAVSSAARPRATPRLPHLAADEVVELLDRVRRCGEGRWMARCPAHEDGRASLSVREGHDGRVLAHCFAGCEFLAICDALGLHPSQLFPPTEEPWIPRRPRHDPAREARELLEGLRALKERPPHPRRQYELIEIGRLVIGGTAAFARMPANFAVRTPELRLVFHAIRELAREGTPRRWFSPVALAAEIDRWGGAGYARERGVFRLVRLAAWKARNSQAVAQ